MAEETQGVAAEVNALLRLSDDHDYSDMERILFASQAQTLALLAIVEELRLHRPLKINIIANGMLTWKGGAAFSSTGRWKF